MKLSVIGNGAWGTALAVHLCRLGHDTTLWFRDPVKAHTAESTGINPSFPEVKLPTELHISADPACVTDCELAVIACPSYPLRSVCKTIAPYLPEDILLVSAVKGIEADTQLRMSQIIREETGKEVVVLSGPSHAEEVAAAIPTACVAACGNKEAADTVQAVFMSESLRVYTSPDVIGVELGGAFKNVIALCAGVLDGAGYGDNTKAMLMTRGLTEMARLGIAMGAQKDTFAGLAGIGDLIVTCTSMHSRNRRAGILIGKGYAPQEAISQIGAVVEGYFAAKAVYALCQKQGVDMPILQSAYRVLYGNMTVKEAMHELLIRLPRQEAEDAGWL